MRWGGEFTPQGIFTYSGSKAHEKKLNVCNPFQRWSERLFQREIEESDK